MKYLVDRVKVLHEGEPTCAVHYWISNNGDPYKEGLRKICAICGKCVEIHYENIDIPEDTEYEDVYNLFYGDK